MKRILHVVGRMDRGGTESMLMSHYRNIDRTQMQFDFVVHTTDHCDFDDEIIGMGGRILRVPRFNLLNLLKYRHAWSQLFENHPEYQILHIHHFLVAGVILPIAAKYGIMKRIVHSHNTKPPIFILKEKMMWLFHEGINCSTDRLACSYDAGTYLFGKKDFIVFNNAIEANKFRFCHDDRTAVRKEFNITDDAFVIGHIGSFRTKQKNHHFLVDVFKDVVKQKSNAVLLLVGDGELRSEIENKIESLGLTDNCVFAGVRNDVPRLLSAMDVFLFPSFFEGLGIVGVEAQASGLPVVASSAIPKEAVLSDLMVQIDLNDPIVEWVQAVVCACNKQPRDVYCDIVAQSGFGIIENVKKLKKIYCIDE